MTEAIDRLMELDERESAAQHDRLSFLSLMASVIEALPDGLIVTDTDGNIVLFNAKAEFMFGRHRSEVVGQKIEILLPERIRENHVKHREIYDRFNIGPHARTMGIGLRLLGIRSDGREFPVDVSLSHMVVPKGVFNLALVRFSVEMAELAAKYTSPSTEPKQQNEVPDAER